jgi:hypothetical protein
MKIPWKKCPSVTPGGKPFFWCYVSGYVRHTICWDRVEKRWALNLAGKHMGYFDTDREAQIRAENL